MSSRNSSAAYTPLTGDEAIAVPIGDGTGTGTIKPPGFLEELLGPQKGRESHLYFGCCCDVRRAVLILNIVTIVMNFFAMVSFFVFVRITQDHVSEITEQMSEDVSEKDFKTGLHVFEGFLDAIMLISIFLHAFGVHGALKYKTWAIKVAAVAYGIPFTWAVLNFDFVTFILGGVFLYPHIVLIKEIETGVMTSYNYENVQACCVC
jgi:hypothetical protein